jgi:hypothetical protein
MLTYAVDLADYMHDDLLRFLLAQDSGSKVTLFETGAIVQAPDSLDAFVVTVLPRAVAKDLATSTTVDLDELESVVSQLATDRLHSALADQTLSDWVVSDNGNNIDMVLYPDKFPSLEFMHIEPDMALA